MGYRKKQFFGNPHSNEYDTEVTVVSNEVIDIICHMDLKKLHSQLALQCAPLIVGLKMSNLFVTEPDTYRSLRRILQGGSISCFLLTKSQRKLSLLLYKKNDLAKYIKKRDIRCFMQECGYDENLSLEEMIAEFATRYSMYMSGHGDFPHEMGIILGYPLEDVNGFMCNQGKNYLLSGYWKVYNRPANARRIFKEYDEATERMIKELVG